MTLLKKLQLTNDITKMPHIPTTISFSDLPKNLLLTVTDALTNTIKMKTFSIVGNNLIYTLHSKLKSISRSGLKHKHPVPLHSFSLLPFCWGERENMSWRKFNTFIDIYTPCQIIPYLLLSVAHILWILK